MQGILANVRHAGMGSDQLLHGFPAVGAPFFASGDYPLLTPEFCHCAFQGMRVFEALSILIYAMRLILRSNPALGLSNA
jgi:hypothetical protein